MYNNPILNDLKIFFPTIADKVIYYWQESPYEIIVELDDGGLFIFDDIDQTIRRLPKNSNNMSEEECKNEFGTRLKKLIYYKGFTQEDLSNATGISKTMINGYITGKINPSFYKVDKICKALGCSMDRLRFVTNENDK